MFVTRDISVYSSAFVHQVSVLSKLSILNRYFRIIIIHSKQIKNHNSCLVIVFHLSFLLCLSQVSQRGLGGKLKINLLFAFTHRIPCRRLGPELVSVLFIIIGGVVFVYHLKEFSEPMQTYMNYVGLNS